jgi:hypothetical protein
MARRRKWRIGRVGRKWRRKAEETKKAAKRIGENVASSERKAKAKMKEMKRENNQREISENMKYQYGKRNRKWKCGVSK